MLIERALTKKIAVRKGEKTTKVPVLEVIAETFALKAAQGDRHAANVVINLAIKSGVLGSARHDAVLSPAPEPTATARDMRPSDKLVESLEPKLLSNDEKIELAKLAERTDLVGDVMELGDDDLLRLKEIVNKGRGKNVEPQPDGELDQAA
jgi:hypothetical protein